MQLQQHELCTVQAQARAMPPLCLPRPPPAADNDSGSKRRRLKKERPAQKAVRRPPHAIAADEARRKAAAAADADAPARTHVKCFYAGLQHGAWVAADALASRATLAGAVSAAFRDDGVACSGDRATVAFVSPDRSTAEFPCSGEAAGWEAAARSAVRVYVR